MIPFFEIRWPWDAIDHEERSSQKITTKLLNGELDAIIVATAFFGKPIGDATNYEEEFVVLIAKKSPMDQGLKYKNGPTFYDNLLLLGKGHLLSEQVLELAFG